MILHANWSTARPLQADFTHQPITCRQSWQFPWYPTLLIVNNARRLAYMRNLAQLRKYAGVFPEQLWNALVSWFKKLLSKARYMSCLLRSNYLWTIEAYCVMKAVSRFPFIECAPQWNLSKLTCASFFLSLIAFWIPSSVGSLSGFRIFHLGNPQVAICLATLILNRPSDQARQLDFVYDVYIQNKNILSSQCVF